MLNPPDFIHNAGVMDAKITHKWEGTLHYNKENPQLQQKLYALAPANVIAIGIATAEWVYWRFSQLTSDREPILLIEAAWAFAVNPAYARIPEGFAPKKGDPLVAGPLYALNDTLSSLLYSEISRRKSPKTAGGGVARTAVQMAFLARHVLPKSKGYDAWLKESIDRLGKWQPKPPDNAYGDPVPRQAMEPEAAAKPTDAPKLLDQFLRTLDPGANPYLRSAAEVTAEGFGGVPDRIGK